MGYSIKLSSVTSLRWAASIVARECEGYMLCVVPLFLLLTHRLHVQRNGLQTIGLEGRPRFMPEAFVQMCVLI